jgi:hypothetical protein
VAPAAAEESGASRRILFLGNSYTFYNDLPGQVEALSEGTAAPLEVHVAVQGGFTLEQHWRDARSRQRLGAGPWDFVVLQEQSRRPLVAPERMLRFARRLEGAASRQGGKTVLFMTWPRRSLPEDGPRLAETYREVGEGIGALVAPVGEVWERVRREHPEISLYDNDGSHPAPAGSYLAACVIYVALTGEDPRREPPRDVTAVPPPVARYLERVAAELLEPEGESRAPAEAREEHR